ncbi:OmpA family protein [bacterium]|nr:OmpA family protein [bacterium]
MRKLPLLACIAGSGLMLVAATTSAQQTDDRRYIYAGGVYVLQDDRVGEADGGSGGTFGYGIPIAGTNFDVEFDFTFNSLKTETDDDRDFQRSGVANVFYHFSRYNSDSRLLLNFSPYLVGGIGLVEEDLLDQSENAVTVEAGVGLRNILNSHGVAVRADVRLAEVFNNSLAAQGQSDSFTDIRFNVGVSVPLSARRSPDSDGDGVADATDRCPNSAAGVRVDFNGCEGDNDYDGVNNSLDRCPRTPRGTPVDPRGCSNDTDADGVLDAYDECPNTPPNSTVNASGCARIRDTDRDGVTDSADACPDTGKGVKVDAKGCAVPQTVVLEGVTFETASDVLTPNAKVVLDDQVTALKGQPDMTVEIGGHTDNRGAETYNFGLSVKRAEAVRDYMAEQGIAASRMTARGYGESKPRASNDTAEGRQQNRRVELKVTGQ